MLIAAMAEFLDTMASEQGGRRDAASGLLPTSGQKSTAEHP
jgi:hypothetical protein